MISKRPLTINNSLVHGICNYNCITCGVNKPAYKGPKAYQSAEITQMIIMRVREATEQGIYIRAIGNSGDGESTLHPEFSEHMDMFGKLIKEWNSSRYPAPEVCVVTNGYNLNSTKILESLIRNKISLKISLPTIKPEHYVEIMQPLDIKQDRQKFLDKLVDSINKVMTLVKDKKVPSLEFHISPPYYPYTRSDFPATIKFLAALAEKNGLKKLNLAMFPTVANRTGLVRVSRNKKNSLDMYRDYFKIYNQQRINKVLINMRLSYKYFFANKYELWDSLNAHKYPCLWYSGNIFITPNGESCCCNDQNILEPIGNIKTHTIGEIMKIKEERLPGSICKTCNQTPAKLVKLGFLRVYHILALIKIRFMNIIRRGNKKKEKL